MPWDASRVNALWGTQSALLGDPNLDYLRKYVDALAQIANIFEKGGTSIDDETMAPSMSNCNEGDNPDKIRSTFIFELNFNTGIEPPPTAEAVPLVAGFVVPTPPEPRIPIPPGILDARHRVEAMRTPQARRRGETLAVTARSLLGNWRWVERAPDSILPYRHARNNTTQYTDINGFDRWLQGGGPAPSGTIALNCRDAVLVTAWRAGLLGHGQVRAVYMLAESCARKVLDDATLYEMHQRDSSVWTAEQQRLGGIAFVTYLKVIDDQLTKYRNAFPIRLEHGLRPLSGDLVFVNRRRFDLPPGVSPDFAPPAHVCLSLGRRWIEGKPVDQVASLWHHNNGTFTCANLWDMADDPNDMTFMPCPF